MLKGKAQLKLLVANKVRRHGSWAWLLLVFEAV